MFINIRIVHSLSLSLSLCFVIPSATTAILILIHESNVLLAVDLDAKAFPFIGCL